MILSLRAVRMEFPRDRPDCEELGAAAAASAFLARACTLRKGSARLRGECCAYTSAAANCAPRTSDDALRVWFKGYCITRGEGLFIFKLAWNNHVCFDICVCRCACG